MSLRSVICDRAGPIRNVKRTPAGGFRIEGVVARVGVLTYQTPTGPVREYTPAEVLAAAADGLRDAPVTNLHPPENASPQGALVTPENVSQYKRGHVTDTVYFDPASGELRAELAIDDAGLIAAIEGGRRELSLGYLREVEAKPGLAPDGAPYDLIRTKIIPNHVAVVDMARAGRDARLLLDSIGPHERPLAVTKDKPQPAVRTDGGAPGKPWTRPLAVHK